MRVAVTGGAGRLGRVLQPVLAPEHELVIADTEEQRPDGVSGTAFRAADITDFDATVAALDGMDAVVHLAAIPWDLPDNAPLVGQVNMLGTLHVLEACARQRVGRVVIASSICAVGMMFRRRPWGPSYVPVDEAHPSTPDSVYGLSKLACELEGETYSRRYGLTVTCLRIAPVWFEEMNPFTTWCAAGALCPEVNVDSLWAYAPAEDVAQAVRLALIADLPQFAVLNVGASEVCSSDRTAIELLRRHYPGDVAVKDPERFHAEPHAALWSIDRAKSLLGFSPRLSWRNYAHRLEPEVRRAAEAGDIAALRRAVYGSPDAKRLG